MNEDELYTLYTKYCPVDEERVYDAFDDEIANWISFQDLEDGGYDEDETYECYVNSGGVEAQDTILKELEQEFCKKSGLELSEDDRLTLRRVLVDIYDVLYYSGCV